MSSCNEKDPCHLPMNPTCTLGSSGMDSGCFGRSPQVEMGCSSQEAFEVCTHCCSGCFGVFLLWKTARYSKPCPTLVGSLTDIYQPQMQALDTTLSPVSSYPFVLTVDKYAIETMSTACSLTPSAVRPVAGRGLLDICPCSESSIMQTIHCDHALEVLQSP